MEKSQVLFRELLVCLLATTMMALLVSSINTGDMVRKKDEFYYFVTRILQAINPGADFKRLMKTKLISDIFSVTDEAFGLIILHNEYHVWVSQQEEGYTGRNDGTKLKKRYTDGKSGKREAWDSEGRCVFNDLCREVHQLREIPETGKTMEEQLRKQIIKDNPSRDMNTGERGINTAMLGGRTVDNYKENGLDDLFVSGGQQEAV